MSFETEQVAALCGILLALAAFLSAVRLTLARASRARVAAPEAGADGEPGRPPPLRARVLGALLVGNVLLNTAATALATGALVAAFDDAGVAYAVAIVFPLVVAGEALARALVQRGVVPRAMRALGIPVERYARKLTADEEIRGRLDLLHRQGDVVKAERDMLGGLLDLRKLTVADVMVHRTKMRTVDADLPPAELARAVIGSPFTRLPLWRDEPDNIVGLLHAKDLLRALQAIRGEGTLDVDAVATLPWFVPGTTALRDQLTAFLARKQHSALVVDEYGDLMGLVTLEDILEEIVGEISDEHDVAARGVRPQPDGSLLVDGSVPIRDLNRMMDWTLPDEEATTVAGLVIHEAQAIPDPGQVFRFHGFRFEVLRRVRNRIAALRVARLVQP